MTEHDTAADPALEDGQAPALTTDDPGAPEAGEAEAEQGTAVDLPDHTEPDPDPETGQDPGAVAQQARYDAIGYPTGRATE